MRSRVLLILALCSVVALPLPAPYKIRIGNLNAVETESSSWDGAAETPCQASPRELKFTLDASTSREVTSALRTAYDDGEVFDITLSDDTQNHALVTARVLGLRSIRAADGSTTNEYAVSFDGCATHPPAASRG